MQLVYAMRELAGDGVFAVPMDCESEGSLDGAQHFSHVGCD